MDTCEHVITRDMIKCKNKICFYYDSIGSKLREIELDEDERYIKNFRFLNNIDATVIEILPKDKIHEDYFLSPNFNYVYNFDELENEDISLLEYLKGKLAFSYGKIEDIKKNKYKFSHTASTEAGN